ncbi:MAG: hypothetical protein EB116_20730 [Betaproteobacteria bacterium]|nr:hypothetical protein [Betaproteobacteria bacterium]NDC04141.1 hypothetical protein [Betaproteobacteria bacterium]NDF52470.1 hypothetical protein [Betaproteobacteria bacterium]
MYQRSPFAAPGEWALAGPAGMANTWGLELMALFSDVPGTGVAAVKSLSFKVSVHGAKSSTFALGQRATR